MNNKHIVQLDGLRFFAVLMVIIAHWLQWEWSTPILKGLPLVHGVTLFFVLSGFLITRILITHRDTYILERKSKWVLVKHFYIRRFFRIFPIYYALILLLFVINYENTRTLSPWLITYTTNIYQSIYGTFVGEFNHFWSLAVEEQFYLFWPFVILFLSPKKTLPVILITIVVGLFIRMYLLVYMGKWMASSYFTLSCMHSLGIGALLAYICIYKPQLKDFLSASRCFYSILVLYLVSMVIQYQLSAFYKIVVDDFMFSVLSFFIILKASENGFQGTAKKVLENKGVVYLGKISYGLYVYHLFMPPFLYFIASKIGLSIPNMYTDFLYSFILLVIVTHFSWKWFEEPINKMKDRIPY